MKEYEMKFLLTYPEYTCLQRHVFCNCREENQTNYYYDNQSYGWNHAGITCRIREKNDEFVATIKEHKTNEMNCSIENSQPVKNQFDLSLFSGLGLSFQGALHTKRLTLAGTGTRMMLDKNDYLGKTDYELEIEYSPGFQKQAERLRDQLASLVANQLDASPSQRQTKDTVLFTKRAFISKNKSQRFFQQRISIEKNLTKQTERNDCCPTLPWSKEICHAE